MKKILSTVIAVLVIVAWFFMGMTVNEQKVALQEATAIIEANSGTIALLNDQVNALMQEDELEETPVVTEEEIHLSVVWCIPGQQPTEHAWNYSWNTAILNTWASNNLCIIPQGEYSTIRFMFAKWLSADNQVFVWFKNHNAYGRLDVSEGATYVEYSIDAVSIGWEEKDLWSVLLKEEVLLHTYIATFDGNYIEGIDLR